MNETSGGADGPRDGRQHSTDARSRTTVGIAMQTWNYHFRQIRFPSPTPASITSPTFPAGRHPGGCLSPEALSAECRRL